MTANGFERAIAAVRGSQLCVDEDLCINPRGRNILCRRCEKACRVDAIALSFDDVIVSESECTGCGACVPACPAGVFRLPVFDPERFLASLDGCAEVHLHCSESRDEGGGTVIPCHLLFDARLAAAAFAEGVRHFAFHGTTGCGHCPRGDARPHIERLRRALDKWFGDSAPDVTLTASGKANGGRTVRHDQIATDRRQFLRTAALRTAAGAAWLVPLAQDTGRDDETTGSWHIAELRKRPVVWRRALWRRLGRLPWGEGRVLPWHVRSFDETCSGCMACAERCPTGALQGTATDEARSIDFDPSLCTNCTLCQRICPQNAVRPHLARNVAAACAPRSTLMHMSLRNCRQCGAPVAAGSESGQICTMCANEKEMDEEWLALLEG